MYSSTTTNCGTHTHIHTCHCDIVTIYIRLIKLWPSATTNCGVASPCHSTYTHKHTHTDTHTHTHLHTHKHTNTGQKFAFLHFSTLMRTYRQNHKQINGNRQTDEASH